MSDYRIIVCGGRDWSDCDAVEGALKDECDNTDWTRVVIVHGGCPTGADIYAKEYATVVGLQEESHAADWSKHGHAAGPIRNREMAKLGAAVCLAFWDGKSRGTLDMIKQAVLAGIPVKIKPRQMNANWRPIDTLPDSGLVDLRGPRLKSATVEMEPWKKKYLRQDYLAWRPSVSASEK